MAGFGGSVKLTGESEYKKALQEITTGLKLVSAEMKATSSGFAAGEVSQRQAVRTSKELEATLKTQRAALAELKTQLSSMESEYSRTGHAHQELLKQYESEKSKLEEIGRTLGTSSQEYKDQEKVVTELSQEVVRSEKAYDAQGRALDDMRIKTANAENTCNQTAKSIQDLSDKAKEGSGGVGKFGEALAKLGSATVQAAISGLKKLGSEMISIGKQSIDSYKQFEQLEGGVTKLFSASPESIKAAGNEIIALGGTYDEAAAKMYEMEHANDIVMKNAQNAYATAGMSANEYMETVTNFSASLISGLNGDTAKAAGIADTAIRDMSDNANTFGTSMESIQNAYQGFAKGNFTMLDNLKLGYGGTKTEMLRLVKDAGVVEESVKSIDDVSFDQIIEGIHIMQQRMNISGTTAKEAASTIEGSTGSMKAAWQNMLNGMSDENADFEQLTSAFLNTLISPDGKGGMLGNMIPRITQVITGMSSAISVAIPTLIKAIVPLIQENLPIIVNAVTEALHTIVSVLPTIIPTITAVIPMLVQSLLGMLPDLLVVGIQMITSIIDGISEALPQLIAMLPEIITDIVEVISEWLPDIVLAGIEILKALVDGLIQAIPQLIAALPNIIDSITTSLLDMLPLIIETGVDLLIALIEGILKAIPQLIEAMPNIISNIINTLLSMLPLIIDCGIKLLVALIQNMPAIINGIVKALPTLIKGLITGLMNNLPAIISAGVQLLVALVQNLPAIISGIVKALPQIIAALVKGIIQAVPEMAKAGLNLIKGLWNGISNAASWLWGQIKGFMGQVVGKIKGFFGIHSPSTLFEDEIGKNLALGLGIGFSDEMRNVTQEMQDAIPTSFDTEANLNTTGVTSASSGLTFDDLVASFKDALKDMKIELDDEVAGSFVEKTVTRAIYAS